MVSVFFAFIINGDPTVKQFGVGMGVAVAVDATIVRCLLVPAVMALLGRANWWFPRWLDRIVPNFSIEGEEWFRERDAAAARRPRPPHLAPERVPADRARSKEAAPGVVAVSRSHPRSRSPSPPRRRGGRARAGPRPTR